MILFFLNWEFSDSEPIGLGLPFSHRVSCDVDPIGIMLQLLTLIVGIADWADLRTVIAELQLFWNKSVFKITSNGRTIGRGNVNEMQKDVVNGVLYFYKISRFLGVHPAGPHLGEPGGDGGDGGRGRDGGAGLLGGLGGLGGSVEVREGGSHELSRWGGGLRDGDRDRLSGGDGSLGIEDLDHGVTFGGSLEHGEDLLLGFHLGDWGVAGELDNRKVVFINRHSVEESSFLQTEAKIMDLPVMKSLERLQVDTMMALVFNAEGGVVEQRGIGGSAVCRQESDKKGISLDKECSEWITTHVQMMGLLALRWRREGFLISWMGRGKLKTRENIRPISPMRSSSLVKGLTPLPDSTMQLKKEYRYFCLELMKLTPQRLFWPVQGCGPGPSPHSWSPPSPGPGGRRPDQKRLWTETSSVFGEWFDGYDSAFKFIWCPVINSGRGRIGPRSKYKLLLGSRIADKMVKKERTTSISISLVWTPGKLGKEEIWKMKLDFVIV